MITKPTIYTEEFVYGEVSSMLEELSKDKNIVYIGELFESRPYTTHRFPEWDHQFGGRISETIRKIKDTLESRAATGGLKNKLNANITKFHLINNYDWKDKTEVDSNVHQNTNISIEGAQKLRKLAEAVGEDIKDSYVNGSGT